MEILQDDIGEGPESFMLQLFLYYTIPYIALVDSSAIVTIEDDDRKNISLRNIQCESMYSDS